MPNFRVADNTAGMSHFFRKSDIEGGTSVRAVVLPLASFHGCGPVGKTSNLRGLIAYFDRRFQFTRRCIGSVDTSCSVRTRKRPSRVTSYCCLSGTRVTWVWNSISGMPEVRSASVVVTAAAINFLLGVTKYDSLPPARHRGELPPLVEICHGRPGPGNGRT